MNEERRSGGGGMVEEKLKTYDFELLNKLWDGGGWVLMLVWSFLTWWNSLQYNTNNPTSN